MPFHLQNNHDHLNDELKQSYAELLQIFEDSSIGMAVVSLNGKWIRVNRYLCNMFGYTEEELSKLTFNDITLEEDRSLGSDKITASIDCKIKTFEIEKRYIHKNGRIIPALWNSTLIRNLDGSPKYFISQIKDISTFKDSMEALRLSEEKFRLVFDNAPIGITHFDKNGKITMVNKFLAEMLGTTIDKIINLNTRRDIPDTKQKAAFEKALQGKYGFFEGPYTSVTSGKKVYLRAFYAPLFSAKNNLIGGIGITEDISLEKHQEEKLLAPIHEKELLLHEVYHRVKNNLQTVISLINIQMSETVSEEFINILKDTKSRIYAMARVHEVLCRADDLVSISLTNYMKELVGNFEYPQVLYQTKIEQDVTLSVNQTTSLGIVINELVTNSVKHNPQRNISIKMDFKLEGNEMIKFYYSDNGKGLSKNAKIAPSSLGMNLVNLLIEDQMEGKIQKLNKPGFNLLIEFKRSK